MKASRNTATHKKEKWSFVVTERIMKIVEHKERHNIPSGTEYSSLFLNMSSAPSLSSSPEASSSSHHHHCISHNHIEYIYMHIHRFYIFSIPTCNVHLHLLNKRTVYYFRLFLQLLLMYSICVFFIPSTTD